MLDEHLVYAQRLGLMQARISQLEKVIEAAREALKDAIYTVRGSGRITYSPEAIYTPHIYVESVKRWDETLSQIAALEKK